MTEKKMSLAMAAASIPGVTLSGYVVPAKTASPPACARCDDTRLVPIETRTVQPPTWTNEFPDCVVTARETDYGDCPECVVDEAEVRRLFELSADMIPPDLAKAQASALLLLERAQRERGHWQRISREQDKRLISATHFVDFALRHTLPERAKAHGPHAVHSMLAHHPFAKLIEKAKRDAAD